MYRHDIAHGLLPAIIADHQTARVQGPHHPVQAVDKRLLCLVPVNLVDAPGLVHERVGDHRRVVDVLGRKGMEFLHDILAADVGKLEETRQFCPHDQPHGIAQVHVSGILDFLVLAGSVEAHFPDLGQIRQKLLRCGGHPAIAPVALVQHQPLVEFLVVQEHFVSLYGNVPHAEVAADVIHQHTPFQDFELDVIQIGIRRTPEVQPEVGVLAGDIHAQPCPAGFHRRGKRRDALSPETYETANLCILPGSFHKHIQVQRGIVDIRDHPDLTQILLPGFLQPHLLPDACGSRIPAQEVFLLPALLANGLGRAVEILCTHIQRGTLADVFRHIHRERRVSAFVMKHMPVIHEDITGVVHCLKVQQIPAPVLPSHRQRPAIPHDGVVFVESDQGFCSLVGIRNADLPVEEVLRQKCILCQSGIVVVEAEIPQTIEIHPVFPDHLGSGVLQTLIKFRQVLFHILSCPPLFV